MHVRNTPRNNHPARTSRHSARTRKLFFGLTTLVALGLAAGAPATADYKYYDNVSGWINGGVPGTDLSDYNGFDNSYTNSITINSLTFGGNGFAANSDSNININSFNNLKVTSGIITVASNDENNGKYQRIKGGGLTSSASNLVINQNGSGGHLEIGSSIFGNLSFTKNGVGFVDLIGSVAAYTGATTITGGTLQLSGADNMLPTGTTVNITGGTLSLNGRDQTIAGLTGTSSAVVRQGGTGFNTLSVNLSSGTNNFGGTLQNGSGTLALNMSGAGTLTLTGANTYSGDTSVLNGTLSFANGGNVNNSYIRLGDITGTNAATLSVGDAVGGNSINSLINVRSGSSGAKTIQTTNTSGTNTFGGNIYLDDNLTVNSQNVGGTLAFTSTASTPTFDLKNHQLTVTGNGNTVINSVVQNTTSGGSIIKQGSGTLSLTSTNTYTGGTNINGGILNFVNGSLGSSGNITFGGGTLQYASANPTDISSRILNSTSAISIDTNGNNVTFGGAIGGSINGTSNTGGLTKSGLGILTLSAASKYTGVTSINGGVLAVGVLADGGSTSGTLGATSSAASSLQFSGGTLRFTGDNANSNGSTNRLFTLGTGGGTLDSSGSGTVTFNGNGSGSANAIAYSSGTTTTSLTLTGSNIYVNTFKPLLTNTNGVQASLIKSGAGAWVLANSNTYTGGTTVNGGTLTVTGSIGTGALAVNNTNTGTANNVVIDFNATPGTTHSITSLSSTVSGTSGNTAQVKIEASNTLTDTQAGTTDYAGSVTGNGTLNITGQSSTNPGLVNYTGTDSAAQTNVGANATLKLNNPTGPALTGPVAVATGGAVALATNNQIATDIATGAPATRVTLTGGTLNVNGHSDGVLNADGTVAQSMGSLALGSNPATTSLLDFGATQGSGPVVFAFANSYNTLDAGHLNVINYVGGMDQLYIGTSNTPGNGGLTPAQLSQITFNGYGAMQLGNGQITFAPEPSGPVALLIGAGALGGIIAFRRRRALRVAVGG